MDSVSESIFGNVLKIDGKRSLSFFFNSELFLRDIDGLSVTGEAFDFLLGSGVLGREIVVDFLLGKDESGSGNLVDDFLGGATVGFEHLIMIYIQYKKYLTQCLSS